MYVCVCVCLRVCVVVGDVAWEDLGKCLRGANRDESKSRSISDKLQQQTVFPQAVTQGKEPGSTSGGGSVPLEGSQGVQVSLYHLTLCHKTLLLLLLLLRCFYVLRGRPQYRAHYTPVRLLQSRTPHTPGLSLGARTNSLGVVGYSYNARL